MRKQPAPREQSSANSWLQKSLDLNGLSPNEIVDLYHLNPIEDFEWEDLLKFSIISDVQKGFDIVNAFMGSRHLEDRHVVARSSALQVLSRYAPDETLPMWDRLLRDEDASIRRSIVDGLGFAVVGWSNGAGFRDFETFGHNYDETCGISLEQAHNLMLSYAYAENGQDLYSPGRAALSKLVELRGEDYVNQRLR
ncbi:hypothetical protein L6E12_03775 [Actinokineospora sp. PR83]|uniref:HEAT repeat domain-containing protein n=1 Tax=Actinokineospora sp. PR83 TaxID=2884908 RepID=UPI001F1582D5|nr:hypothetical protein [Actinokineospora sp. PR83]MCG8914908.1 hypothetical protein [Actinokineospora sp. PR83]